MLSFKKEMRLIVITFSIFLFITIISIIYTSMTDDFHNFYNLGFWDYFESIIFHLIKFIIAGMLLSFFTNNWRFSFFLSLLLSFYETSGAIISIIFSTDYKYDWYFWLLLIMPLFVTISFHQFFAIKLINNEKHAKFLERVRILFYKNEAAKMMKTILTAFVFYIVVGFIVTYVGDLLFVKQPQIFVATMEFLTLVLTGYFISRICKSNLSRTLLYFGIFNVVLYHLIVLILIVNYHSKVDLNFMFFFNVIISVPAVFAGAYIRDFFIKLKQ